MQKTHKTVLIVDDSLSIRMQLDKVLKTCNYHVHFAENGQQCIEFLKLQSPDLILLDVMMPGLDGFEVCRIIKADVQLKDIPVLMLTSASEIDEKVRGFKAGADDYIIKPIAPEELIARVANHISTAQLVRQLKMEVAEHSKTQTELVKAKDELENRVQKRTLELELANEKLKRERKQLEQAQDALRKSEATFKALVNNVPGMVYKTYSDRSARIFSGCMDLCAYTEKELNDRDGNWLSIIHPDDKDMVRKEGLALCLKPKKMVQIYRIICKHGDIRWVEDHKASFFSDSGEFFAIYGIVFDITERKQIEQALQDSEYRYQGLVNAMNEGLVKLDENWTMTFVNNRFVEMTGFRVDQLVGRRFQDLVSREFKTKAEEQLARRRNGDTEVYELELVRADGKKIFVHCSPKPSYDSGGRYLGGLSVVADITRRKNAELQLIREKEKLEDALAKIKTLSGLLPICANCKKIRDDKGYWNQIENYISNHSDVLFSHSICPDCVKKHYPDVCDSDNGADKE